MRISLNGPVPPEILWAQHGEDTFGSEAKDPWEGDPDSDGKRDPIEGGFNRLWQCHTFVTECGKRIRQFLRGWFASFMCAVVNYRESALCFLVHMLVLSPYQGFGVRARFFCSQMPDGT